MKRVPLGPQITNGLDLSHYNPYVEFDRILANGYAFVFLKATEAISANDPTFARRWNLLGRLGFIRGAYHFFHPAYDPVKQAENFLQTVGPTKASDCLILDWETTDDVPSIRDVANAIQWLTYVEVKTGTRPIIYSSPYFLAALGALSASFTKYPLWIAHYTEGAPLIPDPWKKCDFWQYSESANVLGVRGPVDANYFNGSLAELRAFVQTLHKPIT